MSAFRIGVLGGLGPLATVDFYGKLVRQTPALVDQEHPSCAILSLPQTPDRSRALLAGGASPVPALLGGIAELNRLAVEVIAIPCNTSHAWYDELQAASRAPILHIAACSLDELAAFGPRLRVALLATPGTIAAGFYQARLAAACHDCVLPARQQDVTAAIALAKQGALDDGAAALARALAACADAGCTAALLACTELPLLAERIRTPPRLELVDSAAALAAGCLRAIGITPLARTLIPA